MLSVSLVISKVWFWKIISFLSLQIELVTAIHHIVLLMLASFEAAEEKCWRKLSKGLQWNTFSSFIQDRNSHHIGIILPQVKNKWEAVSVSSSIPFKNTLSWCKVQPLVRASVRIKRIVTGLMTGEKGFVKSKPGSWWNPLATSLALYLLIVPSPFSLILKTHLQPITFLLGGSGTRVQVLLFTKLYINVSLPPTNWNHWELDWQILAHSE